MMLLDPMKVLAIVSRVMANSFSCQLWTTSYSKLVLFSCQQRLASTYMYVILYIYGILCLPSFVCVCIYVYVPLLLTRTSSIPLHQSATSLHATNWEKLQISCAYVNLGKNFKLRCIFLYFNKCPS